MGSTQERHAIHLQRFEVFDDVPDDGIDGLPKRGGIYCILNRIAGRRYVGSATKSMRQRAQVHRSEMKHGRPCSPLMLDDLQTLGYQSFVIFALFWFDEEVSDRRKLQAVLNTELYWGIQLGAHLESSGYNLELGGRRTVGSRFRDQERKLMLPYSDKYELLPGVKLYDRISQALTRAWVPGR